MKTAVIICAFDTYFERVRLLKEYYESVGFYTTVITSNFRHFKKEFVREHDEGYLYIETKPYYKNISFSRLYSHYKFSKDAFNKVEEIKPNLLHVLIPPNYLAKEASKYKQSNEDVILYLDVIDLWPETMPMGKLKSFFPFTLWGNCRNNNLSSSDKVFVECSLFGEILKKQNIGFDYYTLYWAKEAESVESNPTLPDDRINLCYLGSINNIVDTDIIAEICKEINSIKPVTLYIIGDGEKRRELISKVETTGSKVKYYGVVYNQDSKQKIFDKCHYGLNIMKNTVCVGLTMKSLDYLRAGLPIINNIKGDTSEFVNKYNIGVNIDDIKLKESLELINKEINRKDVMQLYNKYFSKQSFIKRLKVIHEEKN